MSESEMAGKSAAWKETVAAAALAKLVPYLRWAASVPHPENNTKPDQVLEKDWVSILRRMLMLSKDITETYSSLTDPKEQVTAPIINRERVRIFARLLECADATGSAGGLKLAVLMYECLLQLNPNSRAANWGNGALLVRPDNNHKILEHLELYLASKPSGAVDALALKASVIQEIEVRSALVAAVRNAPSAPFKKALHRHSALQYWNAATRARDLNDYRVAARYAQLATDQFSDTEIIKYASEIAEIYYLAGMSSRALPIKRLIFGLNVESQFGTKVRTPLQTYNVYDLRQYVFGKRVCLVANSAALVGSAAGAFIDGHDIVVRFKSFELSPPDTGTKIDIHAAIHRHKFNLDVPVHLRIIFSGDPKAWKLFMRDSISPKAQSFVGDNTLRWPVRDASLIGDKDGKGLPTSGFNMLRLLHYLGVCSEINLVGFDFYKSGIFRLPEAENLPLAVVHDVADEEEWVLGRTLAIDGIMRRVEVASSRSLVADVVVAPHIDDGSEPLIGDIPDELLAPLDLERTTI